MRRSCYWESWFLRGWIMGELSRYSIVSRSWSKFCFSYFIDKRSSCSTSNLAVFTVFIYSWFIWTIKIWTGSNNYIYLIVHEGFWKRELRDWRVFPIVTVLNLETVATPDLSVRTLYSKGLGTNFSSLLSIKSQLKLAFTIFFMSCTRSHWVPVSSFLGWLDVLPWTRILMILGVLSVSKWECTFLKRISLL